MTNSSKNPSQFTSANNVGLLSTIFPLQNTAGGYQEEVEQVLEILCDADLPFELILINSSESNIAEEEFLSFGRTYPQIQPLLCPGLTQSKAISMAIRRCSGDLIVVLDQTRKPASQLVELLNDMIDKTNQWAQQNSELQIAGKDKSFNEQPVAATDSVATDIAAVGGINSDVMERVDRWAKAIVAERTEGKPSSEIPQNRPFEKEKPSSDEEIRRVDSKSSVEGPKRLPKFITRFHEFI